MSNYSMRGGFSSLQELIPATAKRTLVIGDMERWRAQGRNLPQLEKLVFIDLDDLDHAAIATHEPDIILSPLVSDDFDAVDVAAKLKELNFHGPYRAVTDELPDPELVRHEITNYAPSVNFDLVVLPLMAGE